jgi:hypothetical protein
VALVAADGLLAALALCLVWRAKGALRVTEWVLVCLALAGGAWLACLALLQRRR